MPITVDSSQWTGESDDAPKAGSIVWGEFADRAALDRAVERLPAEEWFRQAHGGRAGAPADNTQVDPPDTDPEGANRRNLRQNFVGIGTAATSMLAAGAVIATGGAALPAVAAAAAAGTATAAVGEAMGTALPVDRGAAGSVQSAGPALGIRAETDDARSAAEGFLKASGARRVWLDPGAAG
jgi:hypothetical protein